MTNFDNEQCLFHNRKPTRADEETIRKFNDIDNLHSLKSNLQRNDFGLGLPVGGLQTHRHFAP